MWSSCPLKYTDTCTYTQHIPCSEVHCSSVTPVTCTSCLPPPQAQQSHTQHRHTHTPRAHQAWERQAGQLPEARPQVPRIGGEESEAGDSVPGRKRGRAGGSVCQSVLPQAADRWKLKRSREGGREGRREEAEAAAEVQGNQEQPWMGAKTSSPRCLKSGRLGREGAAAAPHPPSLRRPYPKPLPGVRQRGGRGQAPRAKGM